MTHNKRLSKKEQQLWEDGGSAYEITKADGIRYRVTKDGLVPLTGQQAQTVLKKQRKQKPAAGS